MPETDAEKAAAAAAAHQAAIDAAAAKAAADAAAAASSGGANTGAGANEENKFRRLHEAEEKKRQAAEARVAELEAAEKKRAEAQMSELEREKARATELEAKAAEAQKRADDLAHEKLRGQVAAKHHLTTEAMDLLTGADEAALEANAAKLAAIMKQPAAAGTITHPAGGQSPSVDEQINQALKAGNIRESIRLKRERAGFQTTG